MRRAGLVALKPLGSSQLEGSLVDEKMVSCSDPEGVQPSVVGIVRKMVPWLLTWEKSFQDSGGRIGVCRWQLRHGQR